ncbi:hypothetical protein HH303_00760 [Rhodospirillaceae bacterium KN72]|uniref:Uncharacterized protein n=1 Tax=Pacificispira spongiicola TaxID=2729598 RepID=A0A7Y0DWP9_9PROT|nr:hypothetical protein [Pacificispira spongiicola]NMM42987.1 hypothetical protein [Pacificispira spongiicola]
MKGISSFLTASNLANLTIRNPATPRQERDSAHSNASPLVRIATALDEQFGGNLVEQARDADNVIRQLESTKDNAREARKARAKEKLEQIKAQLKMLRLLALDPEAMARQIKQLSRMLAAAVREYASAGGTNAGVSAPDPAMMTATQTDVAQTDLAQTELAQADLAQAGTAPTGSISTDGTTSTNTESDPTVTTEAASASQGAVDSQDRSDAENEAATDAAAPTPFDIPNKAHGAVSGVDKDKEEFMRDVRFIKSMLKSLIEQARRKMENDPGAENDLKESEKALKTVETLLNDMAADTTLPTPTVNVVA